MKTTQEIDKQIELAKVLLKHMPEKSVFGDDNHLCLRRQIKALEICKISSKEEIKRRLQGEIRHCDDFGEDTYNNPMIGVYDWCLGNVTDEPNSEEDARIWSSKK